MISNDSTKGTPRTQVDVRYRIGSMATTDIRSKRPNINRRRIARFRTGWKHALKGRIYGEQQGVTWASAGNRCGDILGELPDEKRDLMYELLVELHTAKHVDIE
jgi:hypothetical protein